MARPGSTKTLDETYERAVYLERVERLGAGQRKLNLTISPIGTCILYELYDV